MNEDVILKNLALCSHENRQKNYGLNLQKLHLVASEMLIAPLIFNHLMCWKEKPKQLKEKKKEKLDNDNKWHLIIFLRLNWTLISTDFFLDGPAGTEKLFFTQLCYK
jgi:hypothetical protein